MSPSPAETEQVVRQVLSELVQQPVRPHDNFFDVGGHSLIAVRAARELTRRTGVPGSPGKVLAAPDVAALAGRIAGTGSQRDARAPG